MEPVENNEDLVEARRSKEERIEEAARQLEDQPMWFDNVQPWGENNYEVIIIDSD